MIKSSSLAEACNTARNFILQNAGTPTADDEFNSLALGIFAFQFKQNTAFANFCRSENRTPDTIINWREIPAVPTRAFKSLDLTVLPKVDRKTVFRSSGTT